mgnify:CR=1 FL=1
MTSHYNIEIYNTPDNNGIEQLFDGHGAYTRTIDCAIKPAVAFAGAETRQRDGAIKGKRKAEQVKQHLDAMIQRGQGKRLSQKQYAYFVPVDIKKA